MKSKILLCKKCGTYTLKTQCPKCGESTASPHPAKYSFPDKYGELRRKQKKEAKKWRKQQ